MTTIHHLGNMALDNFHTILDGRILCGDGDSIAELPFLYQHLLDGGDASDLFVSKEDYESDEIQTYNKKFKNDVVKYKTSFNSISTEWNIPKRYKDLDVADYIWKRLQKEAKRAKLSPDEYQERLSRTKMELRIWKKRDLLGLLRTLIYVVHIFEENKVVWGTGRGSSCASYILYLIGIHQVDSVKYDLDLGEFFR